MLRIVLYLIILLYIRRGLSGLMVNSSGSTQSIVTAGFWTPRGVGIVEVMVSLVIIALGIVGFGMAIPLGTSALDAIREERVALLLARQMMEEIQARTYEDAGMPGAFGLESGEGSPRLNFDDVDDYDQWNESPPQYPDGTPLDGANNTPDFRGFRRKVVVENVSDTDYGAIRTDGTTSSKRITVTVSSEKVPPSFDDIVLSWVANREGLDLMYR